MSESPHPSSLQFRRHHQFEGWAKRRALIKGKGTPSFVNLSQVFCGPQKQRRNRGDCTWWWRRVRGRCGVMTPLIYLIVSPSSAVPQKMDVGYFMVAPISLQAQPLQKQYFSYIHITLETHSTSSFRILHGDTLIFGSIPEKIQQNQ